MVIGELSVLSEWIPEQMEPGTVFVLENAGEVGEKEDPYWARRFPLSMSDTIIQRPSAAFLNVSVNFPTSGSPSCREKPPMMKPTEPSVANAKARRTSGPPGPL